MINTRFDIPIHKK